MKIAVWLTVDGGVANDQLVASCQKPAAVLLVQIFGPDDAAERLCATPTHTAAEMPAQPLKIFTVIPLPFTCPARTPVFAGGRTANLAFAFTIQHRHALKSRQCTVVVPLE